MPKDAALATRRETAMASFKAVAIVATLWVAGCASVADPWPEGVEASADYRGWRLYQQQCARCHGRDGTGSADGPNVLARVSGMGRERFDDAVLTRYKGTLPPLRGRALQMPAWQGEPEVMARLDDLYGYLAARAGGRLDAGPPMR